MFNAQCYMCKNDAYFVLDSATIRFPYDLKKEIFDRILRELQFLQEKHQPHH